MKLDQCSYRKHANHEMVVDTTPVAHNIASLRCKKCNKHIKWLNRDELTQLYYIMAPEDYGSFKGVKTRPVRNS